MIREKCIRSKSIDLKRTSRAYCVLTQTSKNIGTTSKTGRVTGTTFCKTKKDNPTKTVLHLVSHPKTWFSTDDSSIVRFVSVRETKAMKRIRDKNSSMIDAQTRESFYKVSVNWEIFEEKKQHFPCEEVWISEKFSSHPIITWVWKIKRDGIKVCD